MKLYQYQIDYLQDLPARAILACDTGTGKTFMSLAHYQRYGNGLPLLILAPAAKVRTGDWQREINEFFGENNELQYKIFSYEKFSRKQNAIWKKFAPSAGGTQHAVICDEVHRCKNPESGIGKAVYEATKNAEFFVGLSATPLPNGWIDFANYAKIFGFTKNITSFKKDFCQYINVGFPKLIGYHNEPLLTKMWQAISKKLSKSEALDLPPRTFIGVDFERPTEYTRTAKERKTADGDWLETAPALAHALRQTLTEPKREYVSELLEGTNENVVIFYNYVSERDAILELLKAKNLKKKKVFRQDGQKHQLPKKADWATINNSVTLAQYQSGSTGVEMTYATMVIYFSPTYSYADYVQSIGRVHRNGQTAKTTFYNLRTPSTIEESVYNCLSGKQDFQVRQWEDII